MSCDGCGQRRESIRRIASAVRRPASLPEVVAREGRQIGSSALADMMRLARKREQERKR